MALLWLAAPAVQAVECGNGVREGIEECDNGAANSDIERDACRTDCALPYCGDGVVDTGEECDKARRNSDEMPDACRTDCRNAYCGDGIQDRWEECEPNASQPGFCPQCLRCWTPQDDLELDGEGTHQLCPGEYWLADSNGDGVLRVGARTSLDCAGASLIGYPPPPPIRAKLYPMREGIGIVVTGDDAAVHGCTIQGYATAIRVEGSGVVLFDNRACSNALDIDSVGTSYGVKNACDGARNWSELGVNGRCSFGCPGELTVAKNLPPGAAQQGTSQTGALSAGQPAPTRQQKPPEPAEPQVLAGDAPRLAKPLVPSHGSAHCTMSGMVTGHLRHVGEVVAIDSSTRKIEGRAPVAANGHYQMRALPAGSYRVRVVSKDQVRLRVEPPSRSLQCVRGQLRADFTVSGAAGE